MAVKYFREAGNLDNQKVYEENLRQAERNLKIAQEEQIRKKKQDDARLKVDQSFEPLFSKIEKEDYKPFGQIPLALAKAKAGDHPGAGQAADRIEDKYLRATAYCRLAEVQIKAGHLSRSRQNIDQAVSLAGQVGDEGKKAEIWSLIATRHKEAKNPAGARQALTQAFSGILKVEDDHWGKGPVLKGIYQLQQEIGDKAGAIETEGVILRTENRLRQIKEAHSWSHLAKNQLANPALPDWQELSAALKGKPPHELATGLAKTAKDWAEAWAALRSEEAESNKRSREKI